MTSESLQQILRRLFGDAAGVVEAVVHTDRGAVWAFALSGDYESARGNWGRLREALSELQLWPLIVGKRGKEEDVRLFAHAYTSNIDRSTHDIEAVLAEGLALSGEAWLQQRDRYAAQWRAEHEAYLASPQYQADLQAQREFEELEALNDEEFFENPFTDEPEPEDSPWYQDEPQVLAAPQPQPPRASQPQAPPLVWFFLVPARHGWEVPAVLCFGGWNACPAPHEHVALIHEWHQKYGAQLIGLGFDTMLFHVARPPQDYEAALTLGRQKFYFCSGDGWPDDYTPERLARELVNHDSWWFWWD